MLDKSSIKKLTTAAIKYFEKNIRGMTEPGPTSSDNMLTGNVFVYFESDYGRANQFSFTGSDVAEANAILKQISDSIILSPEESGQLIFDESHGQLRWQGPAGKFISYIPVKQSQYFAKGTPIYEKAMEELVESIDYKIEDAREKFADGVVVKFISAGTSDKSGIDYSYLLDDVLSRLENDYVKTSTDTITWLATEDGKEGSVPINQAIETSLANFDYDSVSTKKEFDAAILQEVIRLSGQSEGNVRKLLDKILSEYRDAYFLLIDAGLYNSKEEPFVSLRKNMKLQGLSKIKLSVGGTLGDYVDPNSSPMNRWIKVFFNSEEKVNINFDGNAMFLKDISSMETLLGDKLDKMVNDVINKLY